MILFEVLSNSWQGSEFTDFKEFLRVMKSQKLLIWKTGLTRDWFSVQQVYANKSYQKLFSSLQN